MTTLKYYISKVNIPKELKTNYDRQIQYKEGLAAKAEIVTADTSLSNKLFNQIRHLLSH